MVYGTSSLWFFTRQYYQKSSMYGILSKWRKTNSFMSEQQEEDSIVFKCNRSNMMPTAAQGNQMQSSIRKSNSGSAVSAASILLRFLNPWDLRIRVLRGYGIFKPSAPSNQIFSLTVSFATSQKIKNNLNSMCCDLYLLLMLVSYWVSQKTHANPHAYPNSHIHIHVPDKIVLSDY